MEWIYRRLTDRKTPLIEVALYYRIPELEAWIACFQFNLRGCVDGISSTLRALGPCFGFLG